MIDDVNRSLSDTRVKEVQSALTDFLQRYRDVVGEEGGVDAIATQLADEEHKIVQRLRSRLKEIKKERQKATEVQRTEQSKRDRAESEIREYQKQEGRKSQLESQNEKLDEDAGQIRAELETRRLLVQLLRETVASSRHRAGPAIGKTLRRLIPHITGGRYTDLQVTPELQLRLFTSEKSDFLSATELSGGTYQGLSIGFRLAYSQAFIKAVVQSPQFVFLDEPFKGMDRTRVHNTLSVLTRLSPELRQVLVVIPGIDEGDRELFDAILTTQVGQGELSIRVDAIAGKSLQGNNAFLGSALGDSSATAERLPWEASDSSAHDGAHDATRDDRADRAASDGDDSSGGATMTGASGNGFHVDDTASSKREGADAEPASDPSEGAGSHGTEARGFDVPSSVSPGEFPRSEGSPFGRSGEEHDEVSGESRIDAPEEAREGLETDEDR